MEFEEPDSFKSPPVLKKLKSEHLQLRSEASLKSAGSLLTTDPSALEELMGCLTENTEDFLDSPFKKQGIERFCKTFSIPPSSGNFLKGKDSAGNIFYFPKRNNIKLKKSSRNTRLIQENIYILLDQIQNNQKREKILNFSRSVSSDKLWVDKYKPKKYIELAGDEVITLKLYLEN